jgi:hypothetical protein
MNISTPIRIIKKSGLTIVGNILYVFRLLQFQLCLIVLSCAEQSSTALYEDVKVSKKVIKDANSKLNTEVLGAGGELHLLYLKNFSDLSI